MPKDKQSAFAGHLDRARDFLERPEKELSAARWLNRLRSTGLFFYLVGRGFVNNRCPLRAAGLAFLTLLALVPLLAVMLSVSKDFLQERSADLVPRLLDRAVAMIAPQLELVSLPDDVAGPPVPGQVSVSSQARREVVDKIQQFIGNIHSGTLGAVGSVFLVFVGIRLLMTIERSFNDIWGVTKGRSFWKKIVYYWTTITLGPLLLVVAIATTSTVEFSSLYGKMRFMAGTEKFLLQLLPFGLLWIGFSLMYALMPNTHVRPRAAIIGGFVGGTLWQLNSLLSTLYLSRVVTYSKIYGTLGIFPVFLIGIYFSWMILLLGAQVSFAVQNVRTYLQERLAGAIDEEGRELIACRIVLLACHHFLRGLKPPTPEMLSEEIKAPLQLVNQLTFRLTEGGVLSEVADEEGGLQPARAPDSITVADVLHVVRTHAGVCGEQPTAESVELMEKFLNDIYAAERAAPANLRFSELATRLDSATD